ncbi:MerR family transcriptional regulator [Shimia sp.]|uniref:MerR family transcriptional regulator n=1 Tax=Shimia sp. TaxID=1954381 RepID=UPI0032972EBE
MGKSRDAFRTISEVAEWLDTQAHVLRFWESKFTQVKPVKRAGGRRYYRPQDMQLLGGIKKLLHDDGMTIKGAQKLLREKGVKHVAGLSQSLDSDQVIEAKAELPQHLPEQTQVPDSAEVPVLVEFVPVDDEPLANDLTDTLPDAAEPFDDPIDALPEDDDTSLPPLDADEPEEMAPPPLTHDGTQDDASTPEFEDADDVPNMPEEAPADASEPELEMEPELEIDQGALITQATEIPPTSGQPEEAVDLEEDDDLPSQDKMPAFINRAPDRSSAHEEEDVPATAIEPAETAPQPVLDRSSEFMREDFLTQLSSATGIAPEYRTEAAELVARLIALRARSNETETV